MVQGAIFRITNDLEMESIWRRDKNRGTFFLPAKIPGQCEMGSLSMDGEEIGNSERGELIRTRRKCSPQPR